LQQLRLLRFVQQRWGGCKKRKQDNCLLDIKIDIGRFFGTFVGFVVGLLTKTK
jgi:hypothetical protein